MSLRSNNESHIGKSDRYANGEVRPRFLECVARLLGQTYCNWHLMSQFNLFYIERQKVVIDKLDD